MDVRWWCAVAAVAALATACGADSWQWPGRTTSVRIDTKVKFIDYNKNDVVSHPAPFQEALETAGFYNQPAGKGRYPVRSEPNKQNSPLFDNPLHKHLTIQDDEYRPESDGTLDSIQSCKCSSDPHCLHIGPEKICGEDKYLCCTKRNNLGQRKTEFFNEEEDERPELLQAGVQRHVGPFPPPPLAEQHASGSAQRGVLIGPGGPTGYIGPRGYNPRRIHIVESMINDPAAVRYHELSCECTTNSSCTKRQLDDLCGRANFVCCGQQMSALTKHGQHFPSKLEAFPVAPEFDDTPLNEQPAPLLLSPARPASHSILIKPGATLLEPAANPAAPVAKHFLKPSVFVGGATGIIEPTRLRSKSVLYSAKTIMGPAVDAEMHPNTGVVGPGRHVLLAYNRFGHKN